MYDDDILARTTSKQGFARANGTLVFCRLTDASRLIAGGTPAATLWHP